jgi:hypothetical protein
MQYFQKMIFRLLSLFNITVVKTIVKKKVLETIRILHPYQTEKKLIRLGPNGDGGYLVPDDLSGIEACFSPGVGEFSGFEKECLNLGMMVFLADYSVEGPAVKAKGLHFIRKYIGPTNRAEFITLESWVDSSDVASDSDLLLQMDIEGYEYITIIGLPDALLKRFRIIVIEFHHLHKLWIEEFQQMASNTFEKLRQHHTCVHIHPNNYTGIETIKGIRIPRSIECTFIRNDRFVSKESNSNIPHPLDQDNAHTMRSIQLPREWYGQGT